MSYEFPHQDQLLTTKELEKFTTLTTRFWEHRRLSGDTPPFIRISDKCVRYLWGDVCKWLENKKRNSTSDQGGAVCKE